MRLFDGGFFKDLIVGTALLLIGWGLNAAFGKKVKLNHFVLAPSTFTVIHDNNNIYIHTHSLIVKNNGSLPAVNVRVGHRELPLNFIIFPPHQYRVVEVEQGEKEILIERLLPKEQITISYLYFPPLVVHGVNNYVKSDECISKYINMAPAPVISKPVAVFLWFLIFFGAGSALYLLYFLSYKFLLRG